MSAEGRPSRIVAAPRPCSARSARPARFLIASTLALATAAPAIARAELLRPDPHEHDDLTRPLTPVSEREFGLATAALYLRYAHSRDAGPVAGMTDLVMGGIATRAIYGGRVGYGFGLGIELGGSAAPGFGFGFELFPAGVALAIGPTGFFGLFAGLRVDGVTARVPFTLTFPAELRLEVDVTRRARLGAMYAVAWTPASADRRDGSELAPFADESIMAITARFGKTFPRYSANMGRGYFFRLERREQRKTALFGLAFGVEIDVAN